MQISVNRTKHHRLPGGLIPDFATLSSAEAYALRLESLGLIVPELRTQLRDRLRTYYRRHPKAMEPEAEDTSFLAIFTEVMKSKV